MVIIIETENTTAEDLERLQKYTSFRAPSYMKMMGGQRIKISDGVCVMSIKNTEAIVNLVERNT